MTTYYRDILLQLVDYRGCDLGGKCIDIAVVVVIVVPVVMVIMDRGRVRFVVDDVGAVVAAAAVAFPFLIIAIISLQIQIIQR